MNRHCTKNRFLCFILSVLILLPILTCFFSCSFLHDQLDIPDNLHIENGIVMWNSVEKAKGYTVKVGSAEYSVTSNYYSLNGKAFTEESVQISVRAEGDGFFNESSDYCESITYIPENSDVPAVEPPKQLLSQTYQVTKVDLRKTNANPVTTPKYMFRDDDYYYYFFDLGTVSKVPLENFDLFKYENHGQVITRRLESSQTETSAITSVVEKMTSETVKQSDNWAMKIKVEEKSKLLKASAELAYSNAVSTTNSESFSESYSEASSYSKSHIITVDMTFDEDAENGYYGYVLTGVLQVYALLAYNIETDEYYVEYYSDIVQYWTDFYFFESADDFINYQYDTITFDPPENLPIPETYIAPEKYNPINVTMNRYSCNLDNQYNKNEAAPEDAQYPHEGFELGELVLYGCTNVGNRFKIGDKDELSLKYHVLLDPEDLPVSVSSLTKVENDSASRVRGTNIDSQIGYGAYWIRITYTDGTQTQSSKTNIFHHAAVNTYIDLMENVQINSAKKIAEIDVVIAYELYSGGPGFLGIWWKDLTNWRCEYTFSFV